MSNAAEQLVVIVSVLLLAAVSFRSCQSDIADTDSAATTAFPFQAYRIAVITNPFAKTNNNNNNNGIFTTVTNDTALAIFTAAVSIDSRSHTAVRLNSNNAASQSNATMTTSDNSLAMTNITVTFLEPGLAEEMYAAIVDDDEVAKGQLIAVFDVARCSAAKCLELDELLEQFAGITLFTSCCYTGSAHLRPNQHQQSDDLTSSLSTSDNSLDGSDSTLGTNDNVNNNVWTGDLPDRIFEGIAPQMVTNFALQLAKRYKWRRFYILMSPSQQMYDRYVDELIAEFKSHKSDVMLSKGFFCTQQFARAEICSPDNARRSVSQKATVIFLLLDSRADLRVFLNQFSNDSRDSDLSKGKVFVLIDFDGLTAPLLGDVIQRAPMGLMIIRRKRPLFEKISVNSFTVNALGMPNADSMSLMYNEVRILAKALDIYTANSQQFGKLSGVYCGSKFSFDDASNSTVTYSNHCEIDTLSVEVWNVKQAYGAASEASTNSYYLEKVFEVHGNGALQQISQPVWIGSGTTTPVESDCDFENYSYCAASLELVLPGSISGFVVFTAVTLVTTVLVQRSVRRRRLAKREAKSSVIFNFDELEFLKQDEDDAEQASAHPDAQQDTDSDLTNQTSSVIRDVGSARPSRRISKSKEALQSKSMLLKGGKPVSAKLRGEIVRVSLLNKSFCTVDDQLVRELLEMKAVNHRNINSFLGITPDAFHVCALHEFCAKGTLSQVLARKTLQLNRLFKVSFASDIAAGMAYLHQSSLQSHGELTSQNIFVDARWFCKIGNIPLPTLRDDSIVSTPSFQNDNLSASAAELENQAMVFEAKLMKGTIWTAPELLRLPAPMCPGRGTQKADIYSYGVILFEIITRQGPLSFFDIPEKMVLSRIREGTYPPYRPQIRVADATLNDVADLLNLARDCWEEIPVFRPNFSDIQKMLQRFNNGKETQLVDEMIAMMETYAENLEATVGARTQELTDEQRRSEELLSKMLPRSIIVELKAGRIVHPEIFESVTVYFSDIVGFTKLAADSTALEIVNFLNDLYSEFDHVIDLYNVYKVETIGDAYMVASGLPIRHNLHAVEIATMALEIMSRVTTFRIRHRPGKLLQLRVGIHSGPVVAGIVGLKMPRYCLFGDTVNYASRMESSGLALRIHVSPQSKGELDKIGGFHFERRGVVKMKGKGAVETYHLIGKDGFNKPMPDLSLAASLEEHEFK